MSKINEIDYKRLIKRLFVLDMDGTLYLGDEVIPGAIEFVNNLSKRLGYIYLPTTPPEPELTILKDLAFGFPCKLYFHLGHGHRHLFKFEHKGKGISRGHKAFERTSLLRYKLSDSDDTKIVCGGTDTELTYKRNSRKALGAELCS